MFPLMAGERLLLAAAALAVIAAAFPAPAAAVPAEVCETAGVARTCERLLSRAEARDVAAGWYHTCALLVTGNVDCWGLDDEGQAADYAGGDAVGVSAGADRTCALLRDGDVTCWGGGFTGERGFGSAVEVDVGGFHTCVRTEGDEASRVDRAVEGTQPGAVVCFGSDTYGQSSDRLADDVLDVAAGGYHTCVTLETQKVTCWGYDQDERAADRKAGGALEAGVGTTCILRDGSARCHGRDDLGQDADYEGDDAVEIAAGGTHVCVRTDSGDVVCQGDDRYGQAADDDGGDVQAMAAGYVHTCALRISGDVDCWGDDRYGQAQDREVEPVTGLR